MSFRAISLLGVLVQDGDTSVFISGNVIEFPVELPAVFQRFHFLTWDSRHAHTSPLLPASSCSLPASASFMSSVPNTSLTAPASAAGSRHHQDRLLSRLPSHGTQQRCWIS